MKIVEFKKPSSEEEDYEKLVELLGTMKDEFATAVALVRTHDGEYRMVFSPNVTVGELIIMNKILDTHNMEVLSVSGSA